MSQISNRQILDIHLNPTKSRSNRVLIISEETDIEFDSTICSFVDNNSTGYELIQSDAYTCEYYQSQTNQLLITLNNNGTFNETNSFLI